MLIHQLFYSTCIFFYVLMILLLLSPSYGILFSSALYIYRTDGSFQAYSLAEGNPHFAHDMHGGYSRLPPFSQNSPSRFGQQYSYRHSQHPNYMRGERIHHNGQLARSNFAVPDSHASAHTMFSTGMSWGKL